MLSSFRLLICLIVMTGISAAAEIDFVREVRPILSDKCYACHGPDASQRQGGMEESGGLHFDSKEGAFADLGGYRAIVPGNPGESELIRRIMTSDEGEVMPPSDHAKQLTEPEKKTLLEWIQQGAAWKDHWAYVPPVRPAEPTAQDQSWKRNFVDSFILATLERRGLRPSPDADRRILLRRLSFDLTGLPPTPAQVDAFVSSNSEDTYEKTVDRLLASPHFGERLAMYWLDLVRYADTVGYHGDQDVSVSPFRDYVIDAFNTNLPFDQFTRDQLAGDLLDSPTREQLVASGYNKLGMMSAEGGVQPEEYLAKYASDRVRTASTVWMGSTLGCAECHDHKFDPFTSKDFYRFASFFADIKERGLYAGAHADGQWGPTVEVPDEELADLLKPVDDRIAELTTILNTSTPELESAQQLWEETFLKSRTEWVVLTPETTSALHDVKLTIQDDFSVLASGPNPAMNSYTVTAASDLKTITGFQLEVLPDKSLPKNGPGRAGNGNFVVSEVRIRAKSDDDADFSPVELANASATIEQEGSKANPYGKWTAAGTIDKDVKGSSWGWAILPDAGKPNALVIETATPLTGDAISLEITIDQNHTNPTHTLGKFRLSATSAPAPLRATGPAATDRKVLDALATAPQSRTDEQRKAISTHFRSIAPQLAESRSQLEAAQKQREQLVKQHTRTTLITVAVPPREMRVLKRGNWMDKSGELVEPGVPHFLKQIRTEGRSSRLDLADWLTSPDNPLTARVFVNRLWKLYFGTGLSKVLDDVGSQGEPPVHPDLLDALAVEFVESGWNVKHMIKLLVMSRTYRQSSMARTNVAQVDPFNRLYARQSRYRLDAEVIRDNALAVSGLLVNDIGGRSVKPYQPVGLYRHLNFPARTYQQDTGPNQYRRGLYTHWQRQFLHPAMGAFDAPAREECTAERPRSNTPLGALVLLNDPSYVEAARVFAERTLQNAGAEGESGLQWMARHALSRSLNPDEVSVLTSLLDSQRQHYATVPDEARKLLAVGLAPADKNLNPVELAAWTFVARAIFNMHEMVTRN